MSVQPPVITQTESFCPPRALRNGTIQTLMARWQPTGSDGFHAAEQPVLLDAGPDFTGMDPTRPVRLLGYYNRAPQADDSAPGKGLALLLHGWEGCSHAVHNTLMTAALLANGYDVFRLNLRDHGPGLHANPYALNKGIFLGSLIEEAAAATHQIAAMAGTRPFYILGPSMGGNFALRLAVWHAHDPFRNLQRVIAVSPAINPSRATRVLDQRPIYQRYFRERWLGSLRAKARLFPDLYDFSAMRDDESIYTLTHQLVRQFGIFDHAEEYFARYAVMGDAFAGLTVPSHIITAANDPVIPVVDFYGIRPHPLLDIRILPTGGHVGFVDRLPPRHRLPDMVLAILAQDDRAPER